VLAALVGVLLQAIAAAGLVAGDAQRGAAAVGGKTSEAPALREAPGASASFVMGATLQAWRNASAAVTYASTHVTGDGGDAAVLAEACSDERIAFTHLEDRRQRLGVTPMQSADAAGLNGVAQAWVERQTAGPAPCR
jgi:hypothetical protein